MKNSLILKTATTPGKIQTAFHETVKMHDWEHSQAELYKACGEKYGGTKELNLRGHTYIVPQAPEKVIAAYKDVKGEISSQIKIEEPKEHMAEARKWTNSSGSVESLMKDAASLKNDYASFVRELAGQNNGQACFGPNDKFILKGKDSLTRKLNDDMKELHCSAEQAIQRMGDSLRGSVVVDSPRDITNLAAALQAKAKEKGWDITFKNVWSEDRANGYVGVHAKVKLVNAEGKTVLAELQIHLPQIYNGEMTCVKEQAHHVFEYGREAYWAGGKEKSAPHPPPFANQISVLQYLTHLEKVKK